MVWRFSPQPTSFAYLRKGDVIVQRPDSLSGLIDSQQAPLITTINLQLTIHLRIGLHLQVQAPIFGVLTPRIPVQHYSEQFWTLEHSVVLQAHAQKFCRKLDTL